MVICLIIWDINLNTLNMPIENAPFLGSSDMDSPNTNIQRGFHRTARNIAFRGPQGNLRAESIPGNTLVNNPLLPQTGVNKNIGAFYDSVNQQILSFNYNSVGTHGIYLFNTLPQTWQSLLVVGAATDGDILGFLPQMITSVNILYREDVDGDLLFYVDSLSRPTCFNIERYLNTPYPVTKRAYIDLAKAPPVMPPRCTYENDDNATVNNLKNALFQFRERFIMDDFQKTCGGTGSIVPLPSQYFDQITDSDVTKNARISIYVTTGDIDVKKIEIWGAQYSDAVAPAAPGETLSVVGNYFLITTLDKAALNIPSNSIYRFVFRNDGVYAPVDPAESNLPFDWVPQKANCMDLLNGNVPILGGITEGYDPVTLGLSASTTLNYYQNSYFNGVLFLATQGGTDSGGTGTRLRIDLVGTGDNDFQNNPQVLFQVMNPKYIVSATDAAGNDISFDTGIVLQSIILVTLDTLRLAAIAKGFTLVSQTVNTLTLDFAGGFTLNYGYPVFGQITTANPPIVTFAYPGASAEQFGIQYYDSKGRTNGATLSPSAIIKTLNDDSGNNINTIQLSITSRPPIWAYYYDVIRSAALTYDKRTFWISNQTFTNVDLNTGVKYAYVGITYMKDFDKIIEAATNVVSYEFSPGDRVQFQAKYIQDGTLSVFSSPVDMEIISVETNPVLDSVVQSGTFLKIVYPTNSISLSFNFGGDNFQWYKILIYNYVKHFDSPTTQRFYEFGKRFGIGNPGTANAYHIGQTQSQSATLVIPALITTTRGDLFFRFRNVPVGIINNPTTGAMDYSDRFASVPVAIENGEIINARYELRNTIFISSNTDTYNFGNTNYFFWNKQATPVTVRVQGEYQLSVDNAITHNLIFHLADASGVTLKYLVRNFAMPLTASQNKSYDAIFDQFIQIPANTKVFFESVNQSLSGVSHLRVNTFTYFRFSIINNFTIPIIESSFSDKYNIVTNDNSRVTAFDPNAKQQFFPTLVRWALADQLNTNINQTNRFFFQNADEFDKSHGPIVRLKARQRELRIYQYRRTGRTGIYARFLKQNDGTDVVATTNEIISKNNVEYFNGDFGIANQPASLISSGYVDYFTDPVRGTIIRISQDGAKEISREFRVQTWAGATLPKYLNNYPYSFGGNAAIIGVCYFVTDRDSEIIFLTQGSGENLVGEAHSFDERKNSWTSFYDWNFDSMVCAENQLYIFRNGQMWIHNNTTTYCNFCGVQHIPSISIVKNDASLLKKRWINISQVANAPWAAPAIETENVNFGQSQQSNLLASEFDDLEGGFSAHFLNDINSPGGIGNGDELKGTWISMTLQPSDGSVFNYLATAAVKFNQSEIIER